MGEDNSKVNGITGVSSSMGASNELLTILKEQSTTSQQTQQQQQLPTEVNVNINVTGTDKDVIANDVINKFRGEVQNIFTTMLRNVPNIPNKLG